MFGLGAIVSLCYIPGVTGEYIATQWPLLGVLLAFDLLRTVVLPAFGLLPKHPFTIFHAAGLAFVGYAFARWPYSPVPYASVFGLWQIVIMALCVWFGTTMTNMRGLYAGLATGAAISSALAVLQYFGFNPVITTTPQGSAGLYVNTVQQGAILALIAVALVTERMWLWLLPLIPGFILAHSQGAWLALAAGLLGCVGIRRRWVLCATAVAGVIYLWSPLFTNSDVHRVFIWRTAAENLTWLGWGPGVFYTIVLPQNGSYSLYPEYAHNDALQLLFEYGAGALLPYVIFSYALWRTDAKEWPVVFAFVIAGCYSMPLFMPIAAFLALVAVGRTLRSYGVAGGDGSNSRSNVLLRVWRRLNPRRSNLSVAPRLAAKG